MKKRKARRCASRREGYMKSHENNIQRLGEINSIIKFVPASYMQKKNWTQQQIGFKAVFQPTLME